jgi:hypothetical protein
LLASSSLGWIWHTPNIIYNWDELTSFLSQLIWLHLTVFLNERTRSWLSGIGLKSIDWLITPWIFSRLFATLLWGFKELLASLSTRWIITSLLIKTKIIYSLHSLSKLTWAHFPIELEQLCHATNNHVRSLPVLIGLGWDSSQQDIAGDVQFSETSISYDRDIHLPFEEIFLRFIPWNVFIHSQSFYLMLNDGWMDYSNGWVTSA